MSAADWPPPAVLATIASLITSFSVPMLFFRIKRELEVEERRRAGQWRCGNNNEAALWPNWLPWADWLLIGAAWLPVLFVILPLVAAQHPSTTLHRVVPFAACAAALILVLGYTVAILAHYRLLPGTHRNEHRTSNSEPLEA